MKAITLVFVSVCIFGASLVRGQKQVDGLEEKVFNQWLKRHNINVPADADINKWKSNVIARFKEMEAHNAKYRKGEVKFRKALNHLSHMSPDERKNRLNGYLIPNILMTTISPIDKTATKDLPDYWNWVDKGVVHKPLDQGNCNDCYMMAGMASIESQACIISNMCEKLSELEALECSDDKCNPGYFYESYNYTTRAGGATLNKNYPYTDPLKGSILKACDTTSRPRAEGTKVAGWKIMPNDVDTIKYYLVNNGPMYMAIQLYPNIYNYDSGIYHDTEGGTAEGGHAVLLVGYGTENGMDYWIIRNSWGPTWGEQGYGRILRGTDFIKCESQYPTYPIMN